jgi:hypothetical protein
MSAQKAKTVPYGDRADAPPTEIMYGADVSKLPNGGDVDYSPFRTPGTEALKASRDYARSATKHSLAEAVAGCIESLRRYGFCVLDDVIPAGVVDEVRNATWCLARAKLSYSNL